MNTNIIIPGDCREVLKTLASDSVDCVVTSPPYWALRDYRATNQIGLEPSMEEHLKVLSDVFTEIKRILKPSGTCWVNYGDSFLRQQGKGFNGNKRLDETNRNITIQTKIPEKCLALIPMRFAIDMVANNWILRNTIIWHKPNAMPESVKDRFTTDFEYIFFFSKSKQYYFQQQFEDFHSIPTDNNFRNSERYINNNAFNNSGRGFKTKENIQQPQTPQHHGQDIINYPYGRNQRTVWTIPTQAFPDAHFATFPNEIPKRCIQAGCPPDGLVLDPFAGSGTTLGIAKSLGRKWIGIECNLNYIQLAERRIQDYECQIKLNLEGGICT